MVQLGSGRRFKLTRHFDEVRYDDSPATDLVAVAMKHRPLPLTALART
ncbi:hypothetical protein T261_0329 [Streptomyces lydicus]|nr:hypothetical protein T261_0329 [Streptomyces lydicus]